LSQILTGSLKWFSYDAPQQEQINIEDIAHSLSITTRFAGQTKFYSVGQHSLYTSFIVPHKYALEALLHDAAEAYTTDIPKPLKNMIYPLFKPIEERIEKAISEKFGLTYPFPQEVKQADNIMFRYEMSSLFKDNSFITWKERDIEKMFLNRFHELSRIRTL